LAVGLLECSVNDLIKNKKASGRSMDIADAERLEKQNKKLGS
jgi:hypothetical protein